MPRLHPPLRSLALITGLGALGSTALAQSAPPGGANASAPSAATSADAPPPASDPPVAGVSVAGTKLRRTPGSAHVVSRAELERYGYDDPHRVLLSVPGVYSRGEDGFGLRPNLGLRGVNPDRSKKVTLLEDGVLVAPAPYSAPAAYYFPMIGRMSAVRVIKGPGAIAYGPQTIGGTIDFVTRPIPAVPAGAIDLAAGTHGFAKAHAHFGASDERFGFLVEGVHLRSDGFKELPRGGNTGFDRNEWMVKAGYTPDPTAPEAHHLELKLGYTDEDSRETYLGLTDADLRARPDRRYAASALDRMVFHRTSAALTHRFEPAPRLRVSTTAYRSDLERSWRKLNEFRGASLYDVLRDPDTPQNAVYLGVLRGEADTGGSADTLLIGPNQRSYSSQGLQTRIEWRTDTGPLKHRVEYGLRVHRDRIARRHSQDPFAMLGGELVPTGGPTEVTAFNEASSTALSFHAIDAVEVGALTLTPGIRVEIVGSTYEDRIAERVDRRSFAEILPGIGAFYALHERFGLLAGVHRGMSPPPPGAAQTIAPERATNYEAGLRYDHRGTRAELIGFWNDYQNLTDVCSFSSGCLDQNLDRQIDAGRARIRGVEAFARTEFEVTELRLPLQLAYTLTEATFLRSFDADDPIYGRVEAGDQLPYVPRHQLNAQGGVGFRKLGAFASLGYVAAMREEPGSAPLDTVLATDPQWVLDAGLLYAVTRQLELYLQGQNLTDDRTIVSRRPFGARPNAPRMLRFGLRFSF